MGQEVRVVICKPPSFERIPPLPSPLRVVAECSSLHEAIGAINRWKPNVVLHVLDTEKPSPSSEVSFLARQSGLPVVCLMQDGSPYHMRGALVGGAVQALLWPDEAEQLPDMLVGAAGIVAPTVAAPQSLSVAVYGAKGGVGATRLAVELALAFRHLGHATLLGDLGFDMTGPLAMLGLPSERSLGDLVEVSDELTTEQVMKVASLHPSGAVVLAGDQSLWSAETLSRMVNACRRLFPVTVWDAPADTYTLLAQAWAPFTHVLCVTTPDAHAIYPLKRRVLPAWMNTPILSRVHLVVNRRTPNALLRSHEICAQLHMPLLAEVDEQAGLQSASGTETTAISVGSRRQSTRTAQQIERLAKSLTQGFGP